MGNILKHGRHESSCGCSFFEGTPFACFYRETNKENRKETTMLEGSHKKQYTHASDVHQEEGSPLEFIRESSSCKAWVQGCRLPVHHGDARAQSNVLSSAIHSSCQPQLASLSESRRMGIRSLDTTWTTTWIRASARGSTTRGPLSWSPTTRSLCPSVKN